MKPTNEHDDDDELSDCDTCEKEDVQKAFPKCVLIQDEVVSKPSSYVLHIAGTLSSTPNIALGLSDNEVQLRRLIATNVVPLTKFFEHTDTIIGVKFQANDYNLFYSGSTDGTIKLYDIRTSTTVSTFTDSSNENCKDKKVLSCFDVSPNCKLLAAGTDLVASDAFILFWDVRNTKLMGGYWESHTDDVTQVKFHSEDSNKLISGSTDGLINLYDLRQTAEEDALTDTFHTESSVEQIEWFEDDIGNDFISCVTHTSDVQLWKIEDVSPSGSFKRDCIAKALMRKSPSHSYVAGVHVNAKNELFLLAGSNAEDGQCVRGLYVHEYDDLKPAFALADNKQRVRSSWCNSRINLLLTGGEKGILSWWALKFADNGLI